MRPDEFVFTTLLKIHASALQFAVRCLWAKGSFCQPLVREVGSLEWMAAGTMGQVAARTVFRPRPWRDRSLPQAANLLRAHFGRDVVIGIELETSPSLRPCRGHPVCVTRPTPNVEYRLGNHRSGD